MHLPLHIMTLLGRPRREYNNVQVTKTNYHRIHNNYRHSSEVDNRFQQYNMRLCILGRGENKIKIYNTQKKKYIYTDNNNRNYKNFKGFRSSPNKIKQRHSQHCTGVVGIIHPLQH